MTVDGEAFFSPMASSKVPMFWKQTYIFTLRNSARFKRLATAKRLILRTPYSLPLNVVGLSFMILAAPSLLPQSGQAGDSGTEVILPLDEERTSQWTPIDSTCITGETRTSFFWVNVCLRCGSMWLACQDHKLLNYQYSISHKVFVLFSACFIIFPRFFVSFPICKTAGASTTSSNPSCPFSAQLPYPLRGPSSLSLCGHDLARLRLDAATRCQSPGVESCTSWGW